MKLFYLVIVGLWLGATNAQAQNQNLDCSGSQAGIAQCQLPIWEDGRCEKTNTVRSYCTPSSNACAAYAGGVCWGETTDGRWFILPDNNTNELKRCQCGCFAEETSFAGANGPITGTSLLSQKEGNSLESLDEFDTRSWSVRPITQVVGGAEEDPSYRITTEDGRTVELTYRHPVVLANADGTTAAIVTADQVKVGDLLLTDSGVVDPVKAVSTFQYEGRMMNFVVDADDPTNHIVIANELRMGDNAWQNRLAATEARILERADIVAEIIYVRGKKGS